MVKRIRKAKRKTITKDVIKLINNIYVDDYDTNNPNTRICPKCNKEHAEHRKLKIPYRVLGVGFNTPGWRSYYMYWCFACLKTEVLLPSE